MLTFQWEALRHGDTVFVHDVSDADLGPQMPQPGADEGRALRLAAGMAVALAVAALVIWVTLELLK